MNRLLSLAAVAFLVLGCNLPSSDFVQGVDAGWRVISPEYIAYVDADTSISPEAKVTRKRTAAMLTKLIEEAKRP